ncbi:MAG: cytochrome C [Burkholderiales bacterium]
MKLASKLGAALAAAGLGLAAVAASIERPNISPERGRYLVRVSGCNDCHTRDYAVNGGRVPEERWLTGDPLGWRGPWGTTYPTNLRLYFAGLTEDKWVRRAQTLSARPPMPWFNVRAMTRDDLRSLYRYVRSLGAAGEPAPAYVPPDREPPGPVVAFPMPPR